MSFSSKRAQVRARKLGFANFIIISTIVFIYYIVVVVVNLKSTLSIYYLVIIYIFFLFHYRIFKLNPNIYIFIYNKKSFLSFITFYFGFMIIIYTSEQKKTTTKTQKIIL